MIKFNTKSYVGLLNSISNNYEILPFSAARASFDENKDVTGICCLRHDVDYCVESALKLACIEEEMGVTSTYYFLMDSDCYNPFSKRSRDLIHQIVGMGHEVGIHFDVCGYERSEYGEAIRRQKSYLEDISGIDVKTISYHNPGVVGLENLVLSPNVEGIANTYATDFNQVVEYVSDSMCQFRNENFAQEFAVAKHKNIHLLLHPVWWVERSEDRDQKIFNNINSKMKSLLDEYDSNLIKYGLKA